MYLNDAQLDSGALARRLLAPANNLVPVNLLSRQQASLEDAGTAGWLTKYGTCTLARTTTAAAVGTAALQGTWTSGATSAWFVTNPPIPVSPGKTYTAAASVRSGVALRTAYVRIAWIDSTGADISMTAVVNYSAVNTGWVEARTTGVAPSNAVSAEVRVIFDKGTDGVGELSYVDKVGLWEGAGGSWVNGGERLDPSTLGWYWDESVGRRLFVWDTINSRWQMTYGDTGWRDINASMATVANWTVNKAAVRRVNNTVEFMLSAATTAAIAATVWAAPPSGFRFRRYIADTGWAILASDGSRNVGVLSTQAGGDSFGWNTGTASVAYNVDAHYFTDEAWPSALPGTASGSIPNL